MVAVAEKQSQELPTVSLLVAMGNEAGYIERCIKTLCAQDYSELCLEIFVIDGQTTDGSRQIVKELFKGRPNCHLFDNPKVIQAAAWNIGIEASQSEIIGIVSAHAELAVDYVSKGVETLLRTGADMVGGPVRAYSEGLIGLGVALATSTSFGAGGARFRYTQTEEETDTVYMGICKRELYAQIGKFDEEMVRNQDDELSYRLLKHGGRIVCNPAICSRYFNRSTFGSLWHQYFQYGFWKVRVLQKHPRQMRLSQFVPPSFLLAIILCILLLPMTLVSAVLLALIFGSYLLTNLVASIVVGSQEWRLLAILPVIFATVHISYGLGFLTGLASFIGHWADWPWGLKRASQ